jgi:hypothetical protein
MNSATYQTIDEQARASAKELLSQGWDPTERGYDIAVYWGDAEALQERLGRPMVRDEVEELERMIRDYLINPPEAA